MKCRYLQGTYLLTCNASREPYIPSQFEFIEYCMHSRHTICPFFLQSRARAYPLKGSSLKQLIAKAR